MTNGEWFMITTTQPLEVKRNGTCVWLCFDNEDANHYALPTKWWDEERVDTSEDLIRRSDAIKTIHDSCFLDEIEEAIYELPTIEPKRGEWIDDDFVGQYRCSECDYYAIDEYDYCPNCGARMKGVDND